LDAPLKKATYSKKNKFDQKINRDNILKAYTNKFFGRPLFVLIQQLLMIGHSIYRTRAIISRGLYFFYPIFTLAAAYIADNLCTRNGNSSFFKLKIRGL
jgi:hypothetical protein